MRKTDVTVVVPTLAADFTLIECVRSLEAQRYGDFSIVVVDNSGEARVRRMGDLARAVTIIENRRNEGFGGAINQGWKRSPAQYLATLNDDAVADPAWLSELVRAAETNASIGMCASQVRLAGRGTLDSAGMRIAADGSSKQRGHGLAPTQYDTEEDVLLPSGSAALIRGELFDRLGGFDRDFFLYCEDTDLGLRARWAGWRCVYVPTAVVEHRYSHSAGRASPLKAYYVERNRLAVVVKNFPAPALLRVPFASAARYLWHVVYMLQGRGAASEFRNGAPGLALVWFVVRAHLWLVWSLPSLLRKRRHVERRISGRRFQDLLRTHRIPVREVAAL